MTRARAAPRETKRSRRKRVAALVSGGLHLHVKRQGRTLQAARNTAAAKLAACLASKCFVPERTIDLRAHPASEFDAAIGALLRVVRRRGVKHVLIALSDAFDEPRLESVVAALTRGSSTPLVRAFATAHESHLTAARTRSLCCPSLQLSAAASRHTRARSVAGVN